MDSKITAYDIFVTNDTTQIKIGAVSRDINAVINGTGTFDLTDNTTAFLIQVTAEDGDTQLIYELTVSRELPATEAQPSPSPKAKPEMQEIIIAPSTVEVDENSGLISISIDVDDLPKDTTAIQTPNGETVYIEDAINGILVIEVYEESIDEDGQMELVILNGEQLPFGSVTVKVVDETSKLLPSGQNETNVFIITLWIIIGLVAIAGSVFIILKTRQTKSEKK